MGTPKKSAEQQRQERMASIERREASQQTAAGLTSDLKAVYGGSSGLASAASARRVLSMFGGMK
ncbi:hypothetical protein JANAI62_03780 [Jannaschia pagri]|uniref:Uncharacterized protein n=1 Tax=Jannaschia pagri TaxID=2829797 RepID=A0ABQ4NH65_9RHOB|nr:hypothetical protein JANAI61_05970 [Jannaschia sp. AI_61]GIT93755.1 hypothetical protein JANAI62_03780 [Jannaschia sp. AI_62]